MTKKYRVMLFSDDEVKHTDYFSKSECERIIIKLKKNKIYKNMGMVIVD